MCYLYKKSLEYKMETVPVKNIEMTFKWKEKETKKYTIRYASTNTMFRISQLHVYCNSYVP